MSYTCRSAWLLLCKRDRESERKKVEAKISIWHDYILPKDNRSSWLNRTLSCTAMMKTAATEIHYTFIIFINMFWSNSSKCCNNLVDFVNYKATNRRALLLKPATKIGIAFVKMCGKSLYGYIFGDFVSVMCADFFS